MSRFEAATSVSLLSGRGIFLWSTHRQTRFGERVWLIPDPRPSGRGVCQVGGDRHFRRCDANGAERRRAHLPATIARHNVTQGGHGRSNILGQQWCP